MEFFYGTNKKVVIKRNNWKIASPLKIYTYTVDNCKHIDIIIIIINMKFKNNKLTSNIFT